MYSTVIGTQCFPHIFISGVCVCCVPAHLIVGLMRQIKIPRVVGLLRTPDITYTHVLPFSRFSDKRRKPWQWRLVLRRFHQYEEHDNIF